MLRNIGNIIYFPPKSQQSGHLRAFILTQYKIGNGDEGHRDKQKPSQRPDQGHGRPGHPGRSDRL